MIVVLWRVGGCGLGYFPVPYLILRGAFLFLSFSLEYTAENLDSFNPSSLPHGFRFTLHQPFLKPAQPASYTPATRYNAATDTVKPMLASVKSPSAIVSGFSGQTPSSPRRDRSTPADAVRITRISRSEGIVM